MSAWIGPLAVFADVAILLALVAAIASTRVSQAARPLIATVAFACAWVLTATCDVLRAQGWTIFMGATVIALSIFVIAITVHLWTQEGVGAEPGQGRRGDQGGGSPGRDRPESPQPGGGGSDPSWWAEFERQLARYIAEGERQAV